MGISASPSMMARQIFSGAKLTQVPDQINRPGPEKYMKMDAIQAGFGEQSNLKSFYAITFKPLPNFQPCGNMTHLPNEFKMQEANLGHLNTDFFVQQHHKIGHFSGTRRKKGTGYGNQHRSSIWNEEDLLPNVLPMETYLNVNNSHMGLPCHLSQKSYGSNILDELAYRGQVNDHNF